MSISSQTTGIRLKHLLSGFKNLILKYVNFAFIKIRYKLRFKADKPLKLHLGCGGRRIDGYINIDCRKTTATDAVLDIRRLPYSDDSAILIEAYHAIEHLPGNDLPNVLKEWRRVLAPNGKLIIECPDFDKDAREYLDGNEARLDSIFGLQRFHGDMHLFGYNFKRLSGLLENSGFREIVQATPQDYHSQNEPCLRVECLK